MNDAVVWIALASLLLSVLTFVATQFGAKRTSTASYVERLEGRVKDLEAELEMVNLRLKDCHEENVHLMRKLVGGDPRGGSG